MNFRNWLYNESLVSNIIDAGPDGVYLKLDGQKFGPISDLRPQGHQYIVTKKGSPAGVVVDIDQRIAQPLLAKYNQIKNKEQHTQQPWQTMNDLQSKFRQQKGITVYRGIVGQYDPNWSNNTEQYWTPDRNVALSKGGTLLQVFVPGELIDWNRYDQRNKPTDRVTVHGANILDIPNQVLKTLKVQVVQPEVLQQWFGRN